MAPASAAPARAARRAGGSGSAPGLLFTAIFVAAPVLLVLAYMFAERGRFGGVEWTFTLENFRRANDPLYLDVLWSSIGIARPRRRSRW